MKGGAILDMEYAPNSHKSKEESQLKKPEKKLEKVVSGTVRTKKKSEARKLADIFISEDVTNVKSYVLMDVLVPAIKKAIDDIVSDGIHMILYGGSRGDRKRLITSKVSYSRFYNDRDDRRDDRSRINNGFDYDTIGFDNRGDAEAILSAMDDVIDQYGVVSVADLYDLAGVTTNNYAANRYGWTDIRSAKAVRVRDGWALNLPRALPLN